MTRRAFRANVAALAIVAMSGLLAACGDGQDSGVGSLVATPTQKPSFEAPSAAVVGDATIPAGQTVAGFKGGGTYVYDHDDVVATMKLPADPTQDDVVGLKSFLSKAHSPAVRIVSLTVTNHSSSSFKVGGFELNTTDGAVRLYPVATFVNLAMALPGVAGTPDLVSAGTTVSLTSAATIPPGQELTTLVGTQAHSSTVTGVVYTVGQTSVTLEPLWKIHQAAATLARAQAQAAKRLARQEAAAARKKAREEQSGKHKGGA